MSKKEKDGRKQLLIRYRIDKDGKVNFIDPCSDEIPAVLFGEVMKALSQIERKWNKLIESPCTDDKLSVICKGMNDMINSGLIRSGEHYSTQSLKEITIMKPGRITKTLSFESSKRILFLRSYPVSHLLRKHGYIQGQRLDEVYSALRDHASFLGDIATKRFSFGNKTIVCSCIALDYDLFKKIL